MYTGRCGYRPLLLIPNSPLPLFCTRNLCKTQHLVAIKNIKNNWKKYKKIIDFSQFMLYSRWCASSEQGQKLPKNRRSADCTICDEAGGCGSWSRFFRGVCPISNRAKEYCVQRVVVRLSAPAQRVLWVENLRFTANLCLQEAETGPEFAVQTRFFHGEGGNTRPRVRF